MKTKTKEQIEQHRAYNAVRNSRTVSFYPSLEDKALIVEAAKADNRSICSWIENYVMPGILAEAERQLKLAARKR